MDENRVAVVTRTLSDRPSRRDVLCGLAAAGLGLGVARWPEMAEARKKGKKKHKKPKAPNPNAFGCLDVGAACNNGVQCCSGICEGKTCRAHHAGICKVDYDLCTTGAGHVCGIVDEVETTCACVLTTGNAPFCGDFSEGAICRDCAKDTDCEVGFGVGAACVVLKGICEGQCADTGDTACVAPCPKPAK
jgi:hypothetical protein